VEIGKVPIIPKCPVNTFVLYNIPNVHNQSTSQPIYLQVKHGPRVLMVGWRLKDHVTYSAFNTCTLLRPRYGACPNFYSYKVENKLTSYGYFLEISVSR